MEDKSMSILDHLEALRRTLIVSILAIIPGTAIGWYLRKDILNILIAPVKQMHYSLVYIGATEAFMAELTLAFMAGVAIASPVIAYQFWRFILPALHRNERKVVLLFVPLSMILFAVGIVFGYYTVFTYGIQFLLSFGGEGLTPMLSLGKYLSFAAWFLMPFGVMFELPLVILVLVRVGVISSKFLAAQRKWVLIGSFVIAAVVTPTTDMLSQSIMAVAMYLLYEVSIWLSYLIKPKNSKEKEIEGQTAESVETVKELAAEAIPAEVEQPVQEVKATSEDDAQSKDDAPKPDVDDQKESPENSDIVPVIPEGEKQPEISEEEQKRIAEQYKQLIDRSKEE